MAMASSSGSFYPQQRGGGSDGDDEEERERWAEFSADLGCAADVPGFAEAWKQLAGGVSLLLHLIGVSRTALSQICSHDVLKAPSSVIRAAVTRLLLSAPPDNDVRSSLLLAITQGGCLDRLLLPLGALHGQWLIEAERGREGGKEAGRALCCRRAAAWF